MSKHKLPMPPPVFNGGQIVFLIMLFTCAFVLLFTGVRYA